MKLPKILESKTTIRFQDCDPFNHLNNASYFNYMINAREDQILDHYNLAIYKHGQKTGKSWVVSSHQISYLKPAKLMELVTIESQLIQFSPKHLLVEIRMYNELKTALKAVLWSSFVYFNIAKSCSDVHPNNLMELFEEVILPVPESSFDDRVKSLRLQKI